MSIIKQEELPDLMIEFIKYQNANDGEIELHYEHIIDSIVVDGIISDCVYYEDEVELKWFPVEGIFYLFINDINICYYEENKLSFINN